MEVKFTCPHCSKRLKLETARFPKKCRCPRCNNSFTVTENPSENEMALQERRYSENPAAGKNTLVRKPVQLVKISENTREDTDFPWPTDELEDSEEFQPSQRLMALGDLYIQKATMLLGMNRNDDAYLFQTTLREANRLKERMLEEEGLVLQKIHDAPFLKLEMDEESRCLAYHQGEPYQFLFNCPHCGKELRVDIGEFEGYMRYKCKGWFCGKLFWLFMPEDYNEKDLFNLHDKFLKIWQNRENMQEEARAQNIRDIAAVAAATAAGFYIQEQMWGKKKS